MAAAIGASLTVALARFRHGPRNGGQLRAADHRRGYAVLGVIAGSLVVAFGALASAAVAADAIVTVCWLWLLTVIAIVTAVVGRGLTSAQLGVWDFTSDGPWLRNL